jgi:hypothetical protein
MKTIFFQGLTAGALASIASLVYNYAYTSAMMADFSAVINPGSIIGASIFGALLISGGYFFFKKWVGKGTDIWFNAILIILSFASLVSVFGAQLPLEIEFPELFAGLTAPMHFFPALFWLGVKPLFPGEKAS